MSHPLTRRIAQAALLVAAGAAPLAAAGTAAAAGDLAPHADLGKTVTALDGSGHAADLHGAAQDAGKTAAAMQAGAPSAADVFGTASRPTSHGDGPLGALTGGPLGALAGGLGHSGGHRSLPEAAPSFGDLLKGDGLTDALTGGKALGNATDLAGALQGGGLSDALTGHSEDRGMTPLDAPADALQLGSVADHFGGLGSLGGLS